jgi:hypothetical protein
MGFTDGWHADRYDKRLRIEITESTMHLSFFLSSHPFLTPSQRRSGPGPTESSGLVAGVLFSKLQQGGRLYRSSSVTTHRNPGRNLGRKD